MQSAVRAKKPPVVRSLSSVKAVEQEEVALVRCPYESCANWQDEVDAVIEDFEGNLSVPNLLNARGDALVDVVTHKLGLTWSDWAQRVTTYNSAVRYGISRDLDYDLVRRELDELLLAKGALPTSRGDYEKCLLENYRKLSSVTVPHHVHDAQAEQTKVLIQQNKRALKILSEFKRKGIESKELVNELKVLNASLVENLKVLKKSLKDKEAELNATKRKLMLSNVAIAGGVSLVGLASLFVFF